MVIVPTARYVLSDPGVGATPMLNVCRCEMGKPFRRVRQSEDEEEYEDGEEEDPEKVDLPEGVPLSQVLSNDFQGE